MKKITMAEFRKADNDSQGWCTSCEDFTRDCTEPDAEEYDCPICDENTVAGAQQAIVLGFLDIKGSPS